MPRPKKRSNGNNGGQRRRRKAAPSNTGSTNTKSELGIQVVDYFDYEYGAPGSTLYGNVKHFYWTVDQNLFDNNPTATHGQANSFCRVRRCEVYVLPRRNLGIDSPSSDPAYTSNAGGMFTVNVQTPSLAGYTRPFAQVGHSTAMATNTQVTNVLPQIDTFWKKVYSCDMQKTFQSGVVRPYFYGNNQCLFSMRILDPTDGNDYAGIGNESLHIRVKVVLHVDQPIMPIQRARSHILSNFDVGTPSVNGDGGDPPPGPFAFKYVQMDLKKVLHHMS
jgi:hypothetical protein